MLECPICKKLKNNLTKHIQMAHHLTKDEILKQFPNIKLISDETFNKLSKLARECWKNPEYVYKCSQANKSDEARKAQSLKSLNYWKNPEFRENQIIKHKNISKELREKRSQNMRKLSNLFWKDKNYREHISNCAREQVVNQFLNGDVYTRKYPYKQYYFRSSWELIFAKWLDENKIIFEYEKYRFNYTIDNNIKAYIPDFYLPQYNLFVEVKPNFRKDEIVYIKFNSIPNTYNKIFLSDDLFTNTKCNKLNDIKLKETLNQFLK